MPPAGVIGAGPPWPQYGQQQLKQQQRGPQTPNASNYQQSGQYHYAVQHVPNPAVLYHPTHQQNMQQGSHQMSAVQSASITTQWAHQHSGQQGYGHQIYPSQYQPQGYPAHSYAQQNPYQTAMLQPAVSQAVPASSNGSIQNCFNCRMPGHWAMHCPYPHAVQPIVPAVQTYNGPPAKRQRTKYVPPVVTKYEVPDHIKRAHVAATNGASRSHMPLQSGTPPSHNGQPVYIASFRNGYTNGTAPPTPVSALSPGYSQAPGSASTSYSHMATPGTVTPYTPQASPRSAGVARNEPAVPTPPSLALGQKALLQRSTPTNAIPGNKSHARQASHKNYLTVKREPMHAEPVVKARIPTNGPNARGDDSPQDENHTKTELEGFVDEEDDLTLLDMPDIPTEDPVKYGNRPCHLISTPLQAHSAADLDVPSPAESGEERIVSKYIRSDTLHSMLLNVRRSQHFPSKLDDPIFRFQSEMRPAPPVIPPAPPQSHDGSRQRFYPQDVQYKTVSNGPVHEIERASTPVPQTLPSGEDNEEYDPFDPAAGFPEDSKSGGPSPAESGYDPWSAIDASPASQVEYTELNESRSTSNTYNYQRSWNDDIVHLDRKRSYADSFGNDSQPTRRKPLNAQKKRGATTPKKRGGNDSSIHGHRR